MQIKETSVGLELEVQPGVSTRAEEGLRAVESSEATRQVLVGRPGGSDSVESGGARGDYIGTSGGEGDQTGPTIECFEAGDSHRILSGTGDSEAGLQEERNLEGHCGDHNALDSGADVDSARDSPFLDEVENSEVVALGNDRSGDERAGRVGGNGGESNGSESGPDHEPITGERDVNEYHDGGMLDNEYAAFGMLLYSIWALAVTYGVHSSLVFRFYVEDVDILFGTTYSHYDFMDVDPPEYSREAMATGPSEFDSNAMDVDPPESDDSDAMDVDPPEYSREAMATGPSDSDSNAMDVDPPESDNSDAMDVDILPL